MSSKAHHPVPLSPAEAAEVREFAAQRGISEDEAATELFQAGLAGAVTSLTKRKKKAKVVRMRGKK